MKKLLFLAILSIAFIGKAQEVEQVQPSLIVMPFTKSGENALDLYENDFKWQAIVARINNAFQERGFRPKDLQESINQVKRSRGINSFKEATFDVEEEIYAASRPDIVVRANINIFEDGDKSSVNVTLAAIETSSRAALYNLPNASSPLFKTKDYGYLVDRVLTEENRIEKFVEGLNRAFGETVALGKAVSIEIITSETSSFRLDDEVGDNYDFISDKIKTWVRDHAFKNQYRIQQSSQNVLTFDEVRIPLRDRDGNNYDATQFARELSIAIAKICQAASNGPRVKRPSETVSEGTIRITLP